MSGSHLTAETFVTAVERVAAQRNRPVVVKLGGSAMEDPAATDACLRSVAVLHRLGIPLVLVHGGGKPIDRAMAEAGLTPKKVAGRRYTDEATMAIVARILQQLTTQIVARLRALGVEPVDYVTDMPATYPLGGERLTLTAPDGSSIDLGFVGRVTEVEVEGELEVAFSRREVPVLASLAAHDRTNHWLNVNADTAASAVAGALKAEKAIFLTDTPGVLRDRANSASLIPKLTETECRELIASGVIDGGMVPKVEACFEALAAGANAALILDGRVPFSLLDVFLHDTFRGTAITR